METRGAVFALITLTACDGGVASFPDAAPRAETHSIAPTEGGYGDEVTIVGRNFGDEGRFDLFYRSIERRERYFYFSDSALEWSPDRIRFRFPFPAEEEIQLWIRGGPVEAGTFTPSWSAGVGEKRDPRTFRDAAALPGGTLVSRFVRSEYPDKDGHDNKPHIVVFGPDRTSRFSIPDGVAANSLRFFARTDGTPAAAGLRSDAVEILLSAPEAEVRPMGLEGRPLLAGNDAAGPFVWLSRDGGLSRARQGPDGTWQIDRGPIAYPSDATFAVARDGTVVALRAPSTGCSWCPWSSGVAYGLRINLLPDDASAFEASQEVGGESFEHRLVQMRVVAGDTGDDLYVEYCIREACRTPHALVHTADGWQPLDTDFDFSSRRVAAAFDAEGLVVAWSSHERREPLLTRGYPPEPVDPLPIYGAEPYALAATLDGEVLMLVSAWNAFFVPRERVPPGE